MSEHRLERKFSIPLKTIDLWSYLNVYARICHKIAFLTRFSRSFKINLSTGGRILIKLEFKIGKIVIPRYTGL